MKVLLLEDEPLAAKRLGGLIKRYDEKIEILSVIDSVEDAIAWFGKNEKPDCIMMDIQLADGTCFQIFKKIPVDCPVIFTTAYDQYAIDTFRVFSIDYLLKPVTLEQLGNAFRKLKSVIGAGADYKGLLQAIHKLNEQYKTRFLVKIGNKMLFIYTKDIAYLYSDEKTTYLISLTGERFIIDYSLDGIEHQLEPRQFFRVNRKVIARVEAIKDIKVYTNRRLKLILGNGQSAYEAIISRERVAAFKIWAEN